MERPTLRKKLAIAQSGLIINAGLVAVKLLAGIVGNSYALIADAVESAADIVASFIVVGGIALSGRPANERYPYGYGRAETLASAAVAFLLLGAALGIGVAAVEEVLTPHHAPALFTLWVLIFVVVVKEFLARRSLAAGREGGGMVMQADAMHHRSDSLTSMAAFIGILLAIVGGPGWESADDWAAIVAAGIIGFNGLRILRPSLRELMERMPSDTVVGALDDAARAVDGVLDTEKLRVRTFGNDLFVDLHVQADPELSLRDAHILSGRVKTALKVAVPAVKDASIHMEPYERHSASVGSVDLPEA